MIMAGQSGVAGHLKIGDGVTILGKSGVVKDVSEGVQMAGFPAVDSGQWRKNSVVLGKLDDLRRRVIKLEALRKKSRGNPEEDRD